MSKNSSIEQLTTLYRNSSEQVRLRYGEGHHDPAYHFSPLVNFVTRVAPPNQLEGSLKLLDVGCGSGWSSCLFAQAGYDVTGVDLNADYFQTDLMPETPNLTLQEGDALNLNFPDNSFDVLTMFQTLEHLPNPRRGLEEMLRVCRPGGIICVVGPNLLSLGFPLRSVIANSKNRPVRRAFLREPGMQRHPFGNTMPEAVGVLPLNMSRVARKLLARRIFFSMRQPDLTLPFYSDNDACYLCNPIDVTKFFRSHGCEIVRNGAFHRLPRTSLIQVGTWVAVRKPLG